MFNTISAIIPVAGYSSRMEAFKPLITIGSKTTLEKSIGLFQAAGLRNIVVVTGYRADEIIKMRTGEGVQKVYNPDFREGMFSSVKTGIQYLPNDCEAFFLLPADMPGVKPETVRQILACFYSCAAKIVYPKTGGRRGHPPLISCELVEAILNWKGDGGLRTCLNQFCHLATTIEVYDPGIRMDMDFPEDYRKMCAYFSSLEADTHSDKNDKTYTGH